MPYQPENPSSDLGQDAQAWLFRELEQIQLYTDGLVHAGHGGIALSTPTADASVITATASTVTIYDVVDEPRIYVDANTTTGKIALLDKGVWNLSAKLVFKVVASGSSRIIEMLVADITNGQILGVFDHQDVFANQTLVSLSGVLPYPFKRDDLGVDLVLQLRAQSGNITLSSYEIAQWSAFRVSNRESVVD